MCLDMTEWTRFVDLPIAGVNSSPVIAWLAGNLVKAGGWRCRRGGPDGN